MNAPEIITDADRKVKDALDVWADWCTSDEQISLLGIELSSIYGGSESVKSWADFEHNCDTYLAENMNALVEGLPLDQQAAVFNAHIAHVFTSNRRDVQQEECYDQAIQALKVGMRKRLLL